jgi:carbon storage regulator CsrA
MFVVARREGEELVIAEHIHIVVLSVTGKIVRLGFEAPDGIRIERVINGNRPERDKDKKRGR